MRKHRTQGLFYVGIILFWQFVYYLTVEVLHIWKAYMMPSPFGVAETFVKLSMRQGMFMPIMYSLGRASVGFILAVLIGSLVGISLVHFQRWNQICRPFLLGIQSLPSICWVPFAILWFGLKESAILFVVVMGSAFSIALAIENSIRSMEPIYIKLARTMGASKKDIYLKVIIPASMPGMITGCRQGWSFAWRALMSAEVMSASIGLGYTLILGRDLADINQVMLIMIVIIVIGMSVDRLIFSNIEKRVLRKRGLN